MPKLVVVESPAKAKTISRFLGRDYVVEASYGHIRDLPSSADEIPSQVRGRPWARLGVNVEKSFEPVYVVPKDKQRHVERLRKALRNADALLLATDEDREGESIVWHLLQVLNPKVPVERIAFHEITPEAIEEAIENPRSVDENLVRAQETRRILDRLYGYTLSPVLWKKIQSGLSAGRVQSVAVRLCVQRERERAAFKSSVYWDLEAMIESGGRSFGATLSRVDDQRLASGRDFDSTTGELKAKNVLLLDEQEAAKLRDASKKARPWTVDKLERKPEKARPAPPFITSTLQQEANRKLGFSAKRTMMVAQELYEGVDLGGEERQGVITYMRTDSVTLSERALNEAQRVIRKNYGEEYALDKPRRYKSKSRNAQEAHEAIRPTVLGRTPESIKKFLSRDQFRLYDLVWKRTIASQMAEAELLRTLVEIGVEASGRRLSFTASGKQIVFPGFLRAYVEGSDDPAAELGDQETLLPPMEQGGQVEPKKVDTKRHETQPPARYTEASLVKKLEDEGIGRPSTYASIIGTIQDRGYVFKKGNALVPTFTAFAVTDLLERHFGDLVDLGFTSRMEEDLDAISRGEADPDGKLKEFYLGDRQNPGLERRIEAKREEIDHPLFVLEPPEQNGTGDGGPILIRIGRFGPYVQRAANGDGQAGSSVSLPDDVAPADFTYREAEELLATKERGPTILGTDPETGFPVTLKIGRYGPYVEITPPETGKGKKKDSPKRASIPKGVEPADVTLEQALSWLELPRILGKDPESGEEVQANVGRFGPYVRRGKEFRSLEEGDDVYSVDLGRALELLAAPKKSFRSKGGGPKVLRELGKQPDSGKPITVRAGRYGPYVTDGETNATLPKGRGPEAVTLEEAVELIRKKAASGPKKGKGGGRKAAGTSKPNKKGGASRKSSAQS